jgi:MerR family transcriptional regulator, copper efflux regulator
MTSLTELKIGGLAERSGTTPPTIRYYEEIGLMPRPLRQGAGQRRYGQEDVRRLTFIRRCRDFGFSIDQVRALVELLDDRQRSCIEARDIGRAHLAAIQAKLAELRALERVIAGFVRDCDTSCAGGPGPDCVPLAHLTRAESPRPASRSARSRNARRAGTL